RATVFSGMTTCRIGSPQVAVLKKISPSGATSQPHVLQEPATYCSNAEPSGRKRYNPAVMRPKRFLPSPEVTSPPSSPPEPYSQPSGPQRRLLVTACVSLTPQPVKRISVLSAFPSPSVSRIHNVCGACETMTPSL